jgi:hypothetical protein
MTRQSKSSHSTMGRGATRSDPGHDNTGWSIPGAGSEIVTEHHYSIGIHSFFHSMLSLPFILPLSFFLLTQYTMYKPLSVVTAVPD